MRCLVACSVVTVGLLMGGCQDKTYVLRGIPFCAKQVNRDLDQQVGLVKPTFLLTRAKNGHYVTELFQGTSGPSGFHAFASDSVVAAVIECAERPARVEGNWVRGLSKDQAPSICAGQRVVFVGELLAKQTDRTKALGYDGEIRLPTLELECSEGAQVVQADDYTLAQKLDTFKEHVDSFHGAHDRLPKSWDELSDATNAPALTLDPWGTPLRFSADASQVRLDSAGSDEKFDTDDDVEVLTQQSGGSTHILAFPDTEYHPSAEYDAFLKSKGFAP